MEVVPPLNLSTEIKVEEVNSEENVELAEKELNKDSLLRQNGEHNYVVFQNNENENHILTITGEAVAEPFLREGTSSTDDGHSSKLDEDGHKLYQCNRCEETFARATLLRSHEKSHLQDKVLSCELCSKTFSRLSQLVNHRQEHVKKSSFCPECNVNIASFNALRKHVKTHKSERKYKCSDCPMKFLQHSHLITHMRKHTGEKPFSCSICHTSFKQMSHLTTHVRTHTNDKPYVCDICNTAFSQTGSLKRHKRSHTGEKPFQCDQCQAVFVEKRNLTRHLLSHSGIRPFKCDLCFASFTQFIDLQRHTFSHSGIKPFKCGICGAAFSRKNNLKWHKLTHEGDTPYKCDICHVGFRIIRDLKNHRRSHGETKPYGCDHCKASFNQLANLKRHMLLHSGTREHTCEKCGASFFDKSGLRRHIMRHDGVKKFACDKCQATFLEARGLRRHKLVIHRIGKYEDLDEKEPIHQNKDHDKDCAKISTEKQEGHISTYEATSYHPSQTQPDVVASVKNDHLPSMSIGPSEVSTQTAPHITEAPGPNSNQAQTLVFTTAGQPPKTARPAQNCQNHHSHFHTIVEGEYNQWQTWCFCETPNIPNDLDPMQTISSPLLPSAPPMPTPSSLSYETSVSGLHSDIVNSGMPNQPLERDEEGRVESLPLHHEIHDQSKEDSLHDVHPSLYQQINPPLSEYPQPSQFQNYDDHNSLGTNVSSSEVSVLNNSISCHTLPSANTACSSMEVSIMDSLPTGYSVPPKKNRNVCKENKLKDVKADLHIPYILPHEINIPQFRADVQECPKSHQIQSVSVSEECSAAMVQGEHNFYPPDEYARPENSIPCEEYPNNEIHGESVIDDHRSESTNLHQGSSDLLKYPQQSLDNLQKHSMASKPQEIYDADPALEVTDGEVTDDDVQLQYSLTVNNPATGDIQIQSESFPARQVECEGLPKSNSSHRPPLKKRRVAKCQEKNELKYKCPMCSKVYNRQCQLDLHMRIHNGEKPFICGLCHQAFAHNNSLTVHMRCHTGERPYSCCFCKACFTQKSNLRVHLRTHTGERPFKCSTCEATFSQGSHLTAHKRIHSNDRPYTCNTCNQAFTQKSALKRHQAKHSPFKCDICKKCFSQKEMLVKHIHKHLDNKTSTSTTPIKCKIEDTDEVYNDKEVKNNESLSRFPCTVENCTETFDQQEALLNHIQEIHQLIEESPSPLNESTNVNPSTNSGIVEGNAIENNQFNPLENKEPEPPNSTFVKVKEEPITTNKAVKHRRKVQEPTRSSKRIREAAGRKPLRGLDSDFITDLDEIDKVEELDEKLLKAYRKNILRKKELSESSSNGVQSWCFCEVPHGANEPHTNNKSTAELITEKTIEPKDQGSPRDNVILTINPLRDTVVLQNDQETLPEVHPTDDHITINADDIMLDSREMNDSETIESRGASTIDSQIMSNNDQLISSHVIEGQVLDDVRPVYGSQIISSQMLPGNQYMAHDGTLYIEAAEIINNGTVLLNTSPGTLFFDISPDGQLINVPIGSNAIQEPVIVTSDPVGGPADKYCYSSESQNHLPAHTISITTGTGSHSNQLLQRHHSDMASTVLDDGVLLASSSDLNDEGRISVTAAGISVSEGVINDTMEKMDNPSELHQEKPNKPIIVNPPHCSVCQKVFAAKKSLRQHMQAEHSFMYCCNICLDAFTSNEHLTTHKARHKVSLRCDDCDSTFNSRKAFTRHRQKIHLEGSNRGRKEERPFSCNQCESKFFQFSDLKRHLLSHSGAKPFKCAHCGAGFTRKSSLNKHERIHTGEKPYRCKKCDQSFAYRYQFNRHKDCECTYGNDM